MNRELAAMKILENDRRRSVMIEYLKLKISEYDWHGVQDATSDLRDLAVERQTLVDLLDAG